MRKGIVQLSSKLGIYSRRSKQRNSSVIKLSFWIIQAPKAILFRKNSWILIVDFQFPIVPSCLVHTAVMMLS
uniref:Uncharacterized protein n=1 Tax=Lutzomyia longipalpis TaxID=7200 RepID=A0A1B0CI76_LUTLO